MEKQSQSRTSLLTSRQDASEKLEVLRPYASNSQLRNTPPRPTNMKKVVSAPFNTTGDALKSTTKPAGFPYGKRPTFIEETSTKPRNKPNNSPYALLQRNEDLASRLKMASHRNTQLEAQLQQSKKAQKQKHVEYENLRDQLVILKEKVKAFTLQKNSQQQSSTDVKEQLRLAEIRYTELQEAKSTEHRELKEKCETLAHKNTRFIEYRHRIKSAHASVKSKSQSLNNQVKTLKEQTEVATKNLKDLKNRFSEIRQKLTESANYIQAQNKKFQEERNELKVDFESRLDKQNSQNNKALSTLKKEIARLQVNNQKLKDENFDAEKIFEENIEFKNRAIFAERKQGETQERLNKEIENLQNQLSHFKKEAKIKTVETHHLKQEFEEIREEFKATQEEKLALDGQLENLQILWRNTQGDLEKQRERNKALQKINQQLSLNLNMSRKEMKDLQQRIDVSRQKADYEISHLKKNNLAQKSLAKKEENSTTNQQAKKRIESLIAEIQSGFGKNSPFK